MALRGNLRDFPVGEILQLLGNQKKTGCLVLDAGGTRYLIYVHDGRIVSTREPGMAKDDPLLRFLRDIHRLSDEQLLGIESIHRESRRDLEDLLLNGRYIESEELGAVLERQILDHLMRLTRWTNGSYEFDPDRRWPNPPLVRLNIDGTLIEVARRADEAKRYAEAFPDLGVVLIVRDFPDPNEPLTEEERDLFGIMDGRHTVAEVIDGASLTEYEATEALFRMLEAGWIEKGARRDAFAPPPPPPAAPSPARPWGRELVFAAALLLGVAGLRGASHLFVRSASAARPPAQDVYVAAQVRDLRLALELYRREQGRYPGRLDQLTTDHYADTDLLRVPGYVLKYRAVQDGADYTLDLAATDR